MSKQKTTKKKTQNKKIKIPHPLKKEGHACEIIKPQEWIFKTLRWKDKLFYSIRLNKFFGTPIGFERTIDRAINEMQKKGYKPTKKFMLIQRDENAFRAELLIALDKKPGQPDPAIKYLSGTYLTEYFQGENSRLKNRVALFINELGMKNYQATELLRWYANCRNCQVKQGGQVIILLARLRN